MNVTNKNNGRQGFKLNGLGIILILVVSLLLAGIAELLRLSGTHFVEKTGRDQEGLYGSQ